MPEPQLTLDRAIGVPTAAVAGVPDTVNALVETVTGDDAPDAPEVPAAFFAVALTV